MDLFKLPHLQNHILDTDLNEHIEDFEKKKKNPRGRKKQKKNSQ